MKEYIVDLVKQRVQQLQAQPQLDDIVSRLVRIPWPAKVGFGPERVVLNISGLLIGAVETSSLAAVHILDELLRRPFDLTCARAAARACNRELVALFAL